MMAARDLADGARTTADHGEPQLHVENIEHALDAILAEGRQPPGVGTPDTHRAGAERECLEGIGAATHAAINQHRYLPADTAHDVRAVIRACRGHSRWSGRHDWRR